MQEFLPALREMKAMASGFRLNITIWRLWIGPTSDAGWWRRDGVQARLPTLTPRLNASGAAGSGFGKAFSPLIIPPASNPVYTMAIYIDDRLERIAGFEGNGGNARKCADKHDVSQSEAEPVFFNEPLLMVPALRHSFSQQRIHALGRTDDGRLLHITFTLRANETTIRVISARDMSRKERSYYEQEA
jgi:uncharacterized protein